MPILFEPHELFTDYIVFSQKRFCTFLINQIDILCIGDMAAKFIA